MITLYVAPNVTDRGTHNRIYAATVADSVNSAWYSFKNNPRIWKEVGLINSEGKLVCLAACKDVWDEVKSCEPIIAGATFQFESLSADTDARQDSWELRFKDRVYYIKDKTVKSDIIASGLSMGDAMRMREVGNLFETFDDAYTSLTESCSNPINTSELKRNKP